MNTHQATDRTPEAPRGGIGAYRTDAVRPDLYHRAQVCNIVFDLLSAAQCGRVAEYLRPIPITRLHSAQRAFREIGAIQIASALHATQFSLTRVGLRVPFTQAVATLTAALEAHAANLDHLVTRYSQDRITRQR